MNQTGESPPSSGDSARTADVLQLLRQTLVAQANAFQSSTGSDALRAYQGHQDTANLISQIERAGHLESAFDPTVYRIPASVPGWVPTPLARLFGTAVPIRNALQQQALENT